MSDLHIMTGLSVDVSTEHLHSPVSPLWDIEGHVSSRSFVEICTGAHRNNKDFRDLLAKMTFVKMYQWGNNVFYVHHLMFILNLT